MYEAPTNGGLKKTPLNRCLKNPLCTEKREFTIQGQQNKDPERSKTVETAQRERGTDQGSKIQQESPTGQPSGRAVPKAHKKAVGTPARNRSIEERQ